MEFKIDNRNLTMLESKNENALSYYQSLEYITNIDNKKTIILGFESQAKMKRNRQIDKMDFKIFMIGLVFKSLNGGNKITMIFS